MEKESEIKEGMNEKKATAKATNLPFSLKHSVALCRFIKNRNPDNAIELLSKVIKKKIAVPITGEIPHRKGMKSGRYPVKAAGYFIKIIRNAVANASAKGMNAECLVLHGMANKGSTMHHYGRKSGESKRTNIIITAEEKQIKK